MANAQSSSLRTELRRLIPASELDSLSLDAQFMLRERKLDLRAFLWTLVFGGGAGGELSRTSLHDTYLSVACRPMNESSFAAWLRKPTLEPWLRGVVEHVMKGLDEEITPTDSRLAGELSQFSELFCTDSSLLRLPDALAKVFPGTRTNHSPSSLKVHIVSKVYGSGIQRLKITEGSRADTRVLKLGSWVKDALLLFDLGYYDFARFSRIMDLSGAFISRVKDGTNPIITECLLNHRGRAIKVEGEKLQDVLPRFQRQVIDLKVKVSFQSRQYRDQRHCHSRVLRLVGVWDDSTSRYHLYFTNLEPEQLRAEAVAEAYRLRWQIELLFRQLKGVHGLGSLRPATPETAVAFVYAAILSLLVTRKLIDEMRRCQGDIEADIPFERGARLVQRMALSLLRLVLLPPRHLGNIPSAVQRVLRVKALDPNRRSRTTLLRKRRRLMPVGETKTMMSSGLKGSPACTIH